MRVCVAVKDKAQVLVETMNLREVQAELNAEVAMLNATLQQERSRCSCGNRQDKVQPRIISQLDLFVIQSILRQRISLCYFFQRLASKIKKVSFHDKTAS